MIRTNREELLKVLESVGPGLAAREIIEQSSCLAFDNGRVFTFNDEVACSRKSPLGITGAVKAQPLLNLLSKLSEDEVEIGQEDGQLQVRGKKKKAGIRMEAEVELPIDMVEVPDEWRQMDQEFNDAVGIVSGCASSEESQFVLTCVHIHSDYLESCDRYQIARYPLKTGVEGSYLVRAESLKKILGYDMTEISETNSWIHFRNPAGLVLSCRRYIDEYVDIGRYIVPEGVTPVTLPGGLEEVVDKAQIFSAESTEGNHVIVDLKSDRIVIEGEGATGWYKEMKQIKYEGPPVRFIIDPKLLVEVTKKSNTCGIGEGRIFIDTGKFRYASCTEVPNG